MEFLEMLKVFGPCVAVYVAIRVDIATLKVRMERAESDLREQRGHREQRQN